MEGKLIMSNQSKAYVGNISYNTTEENLQDFFSDCGEITEIKVISDYETGRSKGFAFVTFDSEDSLNSAIEKSGQDLDGRTIKVNKAQQKPKTNRSFN